MGEKIAADIWSMRGYDVYMSPRSNYPGIDFMVARSLSQRDGLYDVAFVQVKTRSHPTSDFDIELTEEEYDDPGGDFAAMGYPCLPRYYHYIRYSKNFVI